MKELDNKTKGELLDAIETLSGLGYGVHLHLYGEEPLISVSHVDLAGQVYIYTDDVYSTVTALIRQARSMDDPTSLYDSIAHMQLAIDKKGFGQ